MNKWTKIIAIIGVVALLLLGTGVVNALDLTIYEDNIVTKCGVGELQFVKAEGLVKYCIPEIEKATLKGAIIEQYDDKSIGYNLDINNAQIVSSMIAEEVQLRSGGSIDFGALIALGQTPVFKLVLRTYLIDLLR